MCKILEQSSIIKVSQFSEKCGGWAILGSLLDHFGEHVGAFGAPGGIKMPPKRRPKNELETGS